MQRTVVMSSKDCLSYGELLDCEEAASSEGLAESRSLSPEGGDRELDYNEAMDTDRHCEPQVRKPRILEGAMKLEFVQFYSPSGRYAFAFLPMSKFSEIENLARQHNYHLIGHVNGSRMAQILNSLKTFHCV